MPRRGAVTESQHVGDEHAQGGSRGGNLFVENEWNVWFRRHLTVIFIIIIIIMEEVIKQNKIDSSWRDGHFPKWNQKVLQNQNWHWIYYNILNILEYLKKKKKKKRKKKIGGN